VNPHHDPRVLVADIGGTNCRLALARPEDPRPRLEHLRVLPTPRGTLDTTLRDYLRDVHVEQPAGIAVAAAGRVRRLAARTWVSLTNASLSIERESLAALARGRGWLLNDLAAVAAALPLFEPQDLHSFGPARVATPGARLVVGVGIGFGAAALSLAGETLDSEAGHADLPATTAEEREWLARLSPRGRVSVEDVLSGPGLLRLYETRSGERCHDVPALIARWRAQEPAALDTFNLFSTWLGRVAGNLVLGLGAWGGVYLIGGVVSGLGDALDSLAFRRGFEDKAPFGPDLAAVPVQRIVHPQPALLGLAALALSPSPLWTFDKETIA
jgi:glucokinase